MDLCLHKLTPPPHFSQATTTKTVLVGFISCCVEGGPPSLPKIDRQMAVGWCGLPAGRSFQLFQTIFFLKEKGNIMPKSVATRTYKHKMSEFNNEIWVGIPHSWQCMLFCQKWWPCFLTSNFRLHFAAWVLLPEVCPALSSFLKVRACCLQTARLILNT